LAASSEAGPPTRRPACLDLWGLHVGNLGPLAHSDGRVEIQIRDLDQAVIGNPTHDLVRLGLSLASAARGSDLPGVTTARILEQIIEGYAAAMEPGQTGEEGDDVPEAMRAAVKTARRRSWQHLARERIENIKPTIPLGKRFWPRLFEKDHVRQLATMLRSRKDNAPPPNWGILLRHNWGNSARH
jgi:uncharacterized protein (DUF2252 family)